MTKKAQLSRRSFVAANAAVAVAATAPGAATAMCKGGMHAASEKPVDWLTATAEDLQKLIGDRFRVRTKDAEEVVLKLVSVEPGHSGPERPAGLTRAESVVAVFDSPDKKPLVDTGDQIHRFSHYRLGSADLLATPGRKRDGDHYVEIVLG